MNLSDIIDGTIEGIDVNTYAGKALLACRNKFKGMFGDSGLIGMNLVVFAQMIQNHDYLASHGYFITEDNREDKYIEILEKDDPKLLDALEKYIGFLDSMQNLEHSIDVYKETVEKVKECDPEDVKSVNEAVKEYLSL